MPLKILSSTQDVSHNFVEDRLAGFLESRYVRRAPDYFVCYLSSHTGCNRGCRFCHLTATGQLGFEPATMEDFLGQAGRVFSHYAERVRVGAELPARYVHFNFMARGEPLENPTVLTQGGRLLSGLGELAAQAGLLAKFNISTILPKTFRGDLAGCFGYLSPTLYYSLYSVSDEFRSRWMPGAAPVGEGLRILRAYQDFSKKILKVHFALIEGENDGPDQIEALLDRLEQAGLLYEFNLVRYNPAGPEQGRESALSVRERVLNQFRGRVGPDRVKQIGRVGMDVFASCGTFYPA